MQNHITQIATTTKTVLYGRGSWIVFFATLVIGVTSAFVLYSFDRFSLIYYADSVSHLVRAREFVDAINPGLFEQLGTAWLPLAASLIATVYFDRTIIQDRICRCCPQCSMLGIYIGFLVQDNQKSS